MAPMVGTVALHKRPRASPAPALLPLAELAALAALDHAASELARLRGMPRGLTWTPDPVLLSLESAG